MRSRSAAVAGMFYPEDAGGLNSFISSALDNASAELSGSIPIPKVLIVPHAGYIYSGLTAAFAYAAIQPEEIRRVVLFGPAHRVPFYGIALPDTDVFTTPLGDVLLDQQAMQSLLGFPQIVVNAEAHAQEHSLEVQLPFLQAVLGDFELIPLCVGMTEAEPVAALMRALWGGEETLFVVSSDLSHFHPYAEARELDMSSVDTLLAKQGDLSHDQACGATAINALQLIAHEKDLTPHLLDYRNSGDTAGDKDRVVGYAAIAYNERRSSHGGFSEKR